jgi:DNA repair protein RadC
VTDDTQQSLTVIKEKSLQLKRLIDDLFELSSMDADDTVRQTEKTNICELVRNEIITNLPEFEIVNFIVDVDIPDIHLYSIVEKRKIERVLENLLENARKYRVDGKWIGIRVLEKEDYIRIEVEDKGTGIPLDEQEQIFDGFYRVDKARSSKTKGSGLGLSIAHDIIKKHGGNIGVFTPESRGTCFWFELSKQVRFIVSEPFTRFAPIIASFSNKERKCSKMEKVYEIQRIRQVIQDVEGGERYIVRSPEDGAKIASQFIGDEDREVLFVMCLNTKNRVVAVHRCHVGGINASLVVPREVFNSAILNNSASIIESHQHPSPSKEDIDVRF